jgi:hypothetical protein
VRSQEPTLLSRRALLRDLELLRGPRSAPRPTDAARLAASEQAMAALDSGATVHVDRESPDDPIPTIYTNSDYIDRAEAERMITFHLAALGVLDPRYEWIWPPHIADPG